MLVKALIECCLLTLALAKTQESPPKFEQEFENYQFEIGSNVTVPCAADGDLPMIYTWYDPSGSIIQSDLNRRIFSYMSATTFKLHIGNFTYKDSGLYTCSAGNQHGLTNKIYNITYAEKGDKETKFGEFSVTVRNVTENYVSFDLITGGHMVKMTEVLYKEALDSNVTTITWLPSAKTEIANLTAAGNYSFHFIATSSNGNLIYGIRNVILLPDIPEVIFRSLNAGTLQIQWFTKLDDRLRSTTDMYELSYNRVEFRDRNNWKYGGCVLTIQIPSCFSSGYTIANLSPGSYYEIRLRAHTSAGFGRFYRNKIHLLGN